jgi:predicted dithiol-disulfide oxidoreductase (DUF899 family)
VTSTSTSASRAARSRLGSGPARCSISRRRSSTGFAFDTGTDVVGYLTENPGLSVFAMNDGVVYQTYSTEARGVEFLMPYYPILDRAPQGRGEGDGSQLWLRRHDEYSS